MTRISCLQAGAARSLLNWSQEELAQRAGIGESTYSDFERGERASSEQTYRRIYECFLRAGVRFPVDGVLLVRSTDPICPPGLSEAVVQGWYMARMGYTTDDNPFREPKLSEWLEGHAMYTKALKESQQQT